jgi:hypothetical protein
MTSYPYNTDRLYWLKITPRDTPDGTGLMVTIDGRTLGCADVAAVARRSGHGEAGRKPVTIADAGMTRAAAAPNG